MKEVSGVLIGNKVGITLLHCLFNFLVPKHAKFKHEGPRDCAEP